MENSATSRQRWALYCITKKDYRNVEISKEEAAKLIQELGNKDYQKKSKKSLSEQLLDYLKQHIDELYKACLSEIGYKSVLEDDVNPNHKTKQRWAFVGCGCGMTWLKYRKSKRAEEIDMAARKFRGNEILNMLIKKLPKKDYNYLKKIGCPFEAIWYQMQNLQCTYYRFVIDFAKEKGINMEIHSHLD
jgi:hypothetical protein